MGHVNVTGETSAKEHAAFARAEFCDAPLQLQVELLHEALNGPRQRHGRDVCQRAHRLCTHRIL